MGINLTKVVKSLSTKNCEPLIKEMTTEINEKDIPCSCNRRINSVKFLHYP